jgi:Fe-S-cluster containining protein
MERYIDLNEISDGRLYTASDMARIGCNDCKGCSACCRGMGKSIVLDPYDIHLLTKGTGVPFYDMIDSTIELSVVDGLVLPNLKLGGEKEECPYLNEEGRCSVHSYRPGICRLFPLGRVYDDGGHKYFIQTKECHSTVKTKVRIEKWLGYEDITRYEQYINDWHFFLKALTNAIKESGDEAMSRNAGVAILNHFFITPFNEEFFDDFYKRFNTIKEALGL